MVNFQKGDTCRCVVLVIIPYRTNRKRDVRDLLLLYREDALQIQMLYCQNHIIRVIITILRKTEKKRMNF